jgi:disease resistance protein RPM1
VQVKALSKEVGIMHTALCKVAQVPREKRDPQVREWADEVREASYDMEDIVDTFLIRVDGKPPQCADPATTTTMKRFFKRMGKLFCLSKMKSRHEIASEIGRITARLEKLTELRERYKVNNVRVAPDQPERLHQCATPETGTVHRYLASQSALYTIT